MADIDVVPKQRTHAWVWVLLAVVILAALFMFVAAGRAHAFTTLHQLEAIPSLPNPSAHALPLV